ncbi:MAG: tyrosine-type recombinase/integrase [Alphaproteobacteria bacterium]
MKRTGRPSRPHRLAPLFERAIDSLCAALGPQSRRQYRGIVIRNFLRYLGSAHPEVKSLEQLQRDPHLLGWMSCLRSQTPPLATSTYILRLIMLRPVLDELAWTEQLPHLARLIRREDIPREPQRLARPLTTEQDRLLQEEFIKRNDVEGNAFLLIRYTGMRIGECVDLSFDCLRSTAPGQWAIHVPLGKLEKERMVPVDSLAVTVVQRLRFYRFLDPLPQDGRLLARPSTKYALLQHLRRYFRRVRHSLGFTVRVVPHQMRHTYATEMLRAGVSFPVLMKLLGHTSPEMTMLYVQVVLTDLQREFEQARLKPRHLLPRPKTPTRDIRPGIEGLIESLQAAHHTLEMFRRTLAPGTERNRLDRLSNRLTKIVTITRKLSGS